MKCRSSISLAGSIIATGLVVACASAVGCGGGGVRYSGPTGQVSGKVAVDGQPLTGGQVVFMTSHGPATGDIGEDGAYSLQWQGKSEVPIGDYRVFFSPAEDMPSSVPKMFLNYSSSGLSREVKQGENLAFDFDLVEKEVEKK